MESIAVAAIDTSVDVVSATAHAISLNTGGRAVTGKSIIFALFPFNGVGFTHWISLLNSSSSSFLNRFKSAFMYLCSSAIVLKVFIVRMCSG